MDIRYCYRVSAEAGLAHDLETSEPSEAYFEIKLGDAKKEPTDYQESHIRFGILMAKQQSWDPQWVTPISNEEYDQECNDEID